MATKVERHADKINENESRENPVVGVATCTFSKNNLIFCRVR